MANINVTAGAAAYAEHLKDPLWVYYNTYRMENGKRIPLLPFPGWDSLTPTAVTSAPPPPQSLFTFDTIGQVIFRSIGHCRLPLRTLWAQGISESGDVSTSNTQTFAAALCAPIDPLEEGEIFAIWDGGSKVFDTTGVVTPAGWTPEDAALLATSLASVVIFPGDEAQLPAALIVADKGAAATNAFRGIRYMIFPNYPIRNGLPQLSVGWQRNTPEPADSGAVEFLAGAD